MPRPKNEERSVAFPSATSSSRSMTAASGWIPSFGIDEVMEFTDL